jgi:hypothetical protein
MTPKEKAKQLFDKFCQTIATEKTDFGYYTNVIQAKQCALISVNELIKETSFEVPNIRQRYWLEVKQEIEKL